MRPDEHKKRKNAQYKKKHGITGKGQHQDSKSSGPDRKKKENIALPSEGRVESNSSSDKKVDSSDRQGTEVEVDDEDSKHFGRRKIVSNWSRYEDSSDSEDDIPEQRGEDFNKLLSEAGGSAAQFRFKDEEEWGEDKGSATPIMSLDFEQLAESLACIPLHRRLGLDDNLFLEEQKIDMHKAATENESKYMQNVYERPARYSGSEHDIAQTNTGENVKVKQSMKIVNDQLESDKKPNSVTQSRQPEKSLQASATVNGVETKKCNSEESSCLSKVNECKSKVVQSLEEDLDLILSLDEHSEVKYVNSSSTKPVPNSSSVKLEENGNTGGKSIKADVKPNTTSNGKQNLEDWLDSMLDE